MRKENQPLTAAQELLKDKEMLVSRPEGMDYESYKILLKIQNKMLKRALRK